MKPFRASLVITTLTGALAVTGAAMAADRVCTDQPQARWMPSQKVAERFAARGYEVRNAKIEGTCVAVYAIKDGQKTEFFVDPVSGRIVDTEEK